MGQYLSRILGPSEEEGNPAETAPSFEGIAGIKTQYKLHGSADNGLLGLMPRDVLMTVTAQLSPKDRRQLAASARFFRELLPPPSEHLYRALRDEAPLTSASADASAASPEAEVIMTPDLKAYLQSVMQLIDAYKEYFSFYLDRFEKFYRFGRWLVDGHFPSEEQKRFDDIKEKESALPVSLIRDTGLGVMHATAEYIYKFMHMAVNNRFDMNALQELAVKGIGGAQRAAGECIYIHYFYDASSERKVSLPDAIKAKLVAELGTTLLLSPDRQLKRANCLERLDNQFLPGSYTLTHNRCVIDALAILDVLTKNIENLLDRSMDHTQSAHEDVSVSSAV